MKLPTIYDDDLLGLEAGTYPDGSPIRPRVYSIVYPPVGFFPFADTGNGDYHGFYWPIGREESPPLVAYSSHDAYALIPEYGDMQSAGRCQIALNEDRKLTPAFESAFAAAGESTPTVSIAGAVAVDSRALLLNLDPESPFRNCAVADQEVLKGELESAESHYRKGIERLPEYGAAHFGLGYLLRRLRRQSEAANHLRMALICPLAFSGGSFWADHVLPGGFRNDWARKALLWVQQIVASDESLRADPFLANAEHLTMKTGAAQSRDIDLAMEMVDTYTDRYQFVDAVYLWLTIGDRAALETTSFRERYDLTPATFGRRLSIVYRAAGLDRRAALVDNMLSVIDKPNGLHL